MTPESILEIARRYTVPKEESSLLVEYDGDVPVPTDGTVAMTYWNFCEEELIAFAQSVIEADRESSGTTKQLAAYKTLVDSLEKQNATYRQRLKELEGAEAALDSERECNARLTKELEVQESSDEPVAWAYITKDCKIVHYEFVEGLVPLYRRPAPARKPLSDDEILRVATKSPPFIPWLLQEGVTLGDVRGMAVDFARAIERAHGIGETE